MERPNPEPDEGSTQNHASEDRKFRKRAMVLAEGEDSAQEPEPGSPNPQDHLFIPISPEQQHRTFTLPPSPNVCPKVPLETHPSRGSTWS